MALLKRKRTGLSDPMSVVTSFVNACNRHDAEGVSACLHPEFDSIQPMYPSRNFRGADQVRRNWQAIFDAEPGFRLTVLRSAAAGDTVWLELHGAGREAEVAGVFVMGIEGDRIRWARIYSALVEGAPATVAGTSEQPAPLREVPPLQEQAPSGQAADEDLIAPVVDIDGNGRTRRRRLRRKGGNGGAPGADSGGREVEEDPVIEEAAAALASVPAVDEPEAPSVTPADSIDPENLVDAEPPVGAGAVETDVVPQADPGSQADISEATVLAEPGSPAEDGPDYDLEVAMAVEAAIAEADSEPESALHPAAAAPAAPEAAAPEAAAPEAAVPEREPDVMVETMLAFVPEAAVDPDAIVDPEPEFLVERVIVEPPAEAEPPSAPPVEETAVAEPPAASGFRARKGKQQKR